MIHCVDINFRNSIQIHTLLCGRFLGVYTTLQKRSNCGFLSPITGSTKE